MLSRLSRFFMMLACLAVTAARADEIWLVNGDRVTGEISRIEGGRIFLKPPYAPEMAIDMNNITTMRTEEAVSVTVDQTGSLRARIDPDAEGRVVLSADDWLVSEPVALSRLTSLSRKPEPPVRLAGRVNVGTSKTSGNTDTFKLHVDLEMVARSRINRFTVGGSANRAEDRGVITESNGLAYLKYDHFLSKKWYMYSNATAERDRFKDIRLRTTLGLGTGYQFLETPQTNLSLEGGANYVNTDSYAAEDDAYPALRVALKFDRLILRDRLQLFHQNEVYSDARGDANTFVRTQTGLRMPLFHRVTATLQYNVDWDSDPAPGRVPTDKALLFTLGYQW